MSQKNSRSSLPLDGNNLVLLIGTLSGPPRRRVLPSGDVVVDFDVTTRGSAGTCSVPVAWFDPGAFADRLEAESPVAVAGWIRRRYFRVAGTTQSRTEVVAARVVDATKVGQVKQISTAMAQCRDAPE